MATPPLDQHVLIIGAGVTGLLVAHGLRKAGIPYTIFEREPSASHYRPREWSMGIHWALPQLETLLPPDLWPRLKEAFNDPSLDAQQTTMLMYNGMEGGILKEVPIPRTVRVSRRKFRAFLVEGIDVKYGYEVKNITYSDNKNTALAHFTNGESVSGSLVLGADGPRSKVRSLILGEKGNVTPMDVVHANVAVCYNDAAKAEFVRSAHPVFSISVHREVFSFISILDVPDPKDPANWRFQVVTSWRAAPSESVPPSNAARLAQIKQKASLLKNEPFRNAVLWMPEDTIVTYDTMGYWIPVPWENHNGRVTLAGDAAHPMTPHRGQGLNHAICDVVNLVGALSKLGNEKKGEGKGEVALNQEKSISDYDAEVVKRGAGEVVTSKMTAETMLDWDLIMESPIIKGGLNKGDVKH